MAPILIDSRGLFKLGFSAIIITALIFFGGFFAGYQKASAFYHTSSDVLPLLLPDAADNAATERGSRIPLFALAGEDIDVDQPEVLSTAGKDEKPLTHDDSHAHAVFTDNAVAEHETAPAQDTLSAVDADSGNHDNLNSRVPQADNKSNEVAITASIVSAAEASTDVYGLTAEELEKAEYSIQVGMYGNIINAENMMKMLQAEKINAYVSEYRNIKDERRYNVRFGLFQNKRSALEKLDAYNRLGRGDGYLVRFSVKNLVNLADAGNRQVLPATGASPSMAVESAVKSSTDSTGLAADPAIDPVTDRSNKLSQADLIIPGSPATY